MPTETIRFQNREGHTLAGTIDLPETTPAALALFAHCFTCGKSLNGIRTIAKQLNDEGIAVCRFDFTGLGQSQGEFHDSTYSTNISDLIAAAEHLTNEFMHPTILAGHSLGGAAVLAAARSIPSTRCVATIGAPFDPAHVRHLLTGAAFDEDDKAEVSIGGRPFTIGKQFLDDLEAHDPAQTIASLRMPLLICHSPVDSIVAIENAERIYTAARHPKSFLSLGHADHLVSNTQDAEYLGHVLSAWAGYHSSVEHQR
ncbi:MAG: alpha/beta hydrolase family protein [Phycisphaerales bacterium JB043]